MTQASIHPESLTTTGVPVGPELPSGMWRMLTQRGLQRRKLPRGLDAMWDKLMGFFVARVPRLTLLMRRVKRVLAMEATYKDMSDGRLREACEEMRALFRRGRNVKADVERGFAIVREVAWRQMGMKPYPVQICAGLAIDNGSIAEMSTGEGKTLSATLPATLAGWRGKGCHILTVNDYLAQRDAEEMAPIYRFCGLTVAHVIGTMPPVQRREAYTADVTYTTNKEVAADFLRDRLSLGKVHGLPAALLSKIANGMGAGTDRLVMRGLDYAIVDEADSILIDEAVTPLIISGDSPNPEQTEAYVQAAEIAKRMAAGQDYTIDLRYREIRLTNRGKLAAESLSSHHAGVWAGARRREELVTQAITAREMFLRDTHYVVQHDEEKEEDKVVIVDEFTGRLMPDRTWRDGLHQAIEAKEQIKVNPPKATFARISFQRFFRLYRHLGGMTGTAWEGRGEMWQIYRRPTVIVPTNKPCIRKHSRDRVFATQEAKWSAIVAEIQRLHETGRPILVGTRSVDTSELLSKRLEALGLEHRVLNAVRHKEEAQIVSGAGGEGKITVATNMAGRGTDIKLGRGVAESGGLCVIAAEHNESGRVDRQLFGRAGRQGDPGSAIAFAALDDELLKRHAPRWVRAVVRRLRMRGEELSSPMARRLFKSAQKRAHKMALRQRKSVLRSDDWLDEFLGFAGRED
ncbi:MAG: hypothetical protein WD768_08460 [Phycisphaeraceae bacterium]